jgi:hypothetical protein
VKWSVVGPSATYTQSKWREELEIGHSELSSFDSLNARQIRRFETVRTRGLSETGRKVFKIPSIRYCQADPCISTVKSILAR